MPVWHTFVGKYQDVVLGYGVILFTILSIKTDYKQTRRIDETIQK